MPKEVHATTNDVTIKKRVINVSPAPQTVRVYAVDGSHYKDVFPIDAREIVAGGEYAYKAPVLSSPPELATDTVNPPDQPEVVAETATKPEPRSRSRAGGK